MDLPKKMSEVDFENLTEKMMIDIYNQDPTFAMEITLHPKYNPDDNPGMEFAVHPDEVDTFEE